MRHFVYAEHLCVEVGGCNCGGGFDHYTHEPGCGIEPLWPVGTPPELGGPRAAVEERCDVAARLAGARPTPLGRLLWRDLVEMSQPEPVAPVALAGPCSCRYWISDGRYRTLGSGFAIDTLCPHHGEARRWANLEVPW